MTDCCDDRQWIIDRINATRALIVKYEEALDAFALGAQTYSIDTGQTRQTVSKQQLGSVQLTLARLESRLSAYQQRLGCGGLYMRPAW
jgi:hypothetical protein